jgi:hypothetical protein
VNDPIRHTPADTWLLEFQTFRGAPHKRKLVYLRDGASVEVGARYEGVGYYVTEGKERSYSTGSLFMCAGLDGIETVRRDEKDPQVVIVADRHGAVAAYHVGRKLAADSSGQRAKTAAQMGAVMAGELIAAEGTRDPLRAQYRSCYDEYMSERTAQKLLRATDAFYALAKKEEIYPGFAADELLTLIEGGALLDERERLAAAVRWEGPALVAKLLQALREDSTPGEDRARSLMEAVRALGEDVARFRALVEEDLSRAEADLALARDALTRLLVEDEQGAA